jgi:hypothetical protein
LRRNVPHKAERIPRGQCADVIGSEMRQEESELVRHLIETEMQDYGASMKMMPGIVS